MNDRPKIEFGELEGVIYHSSDGYFFNRKLVGGKWVPNHDSARVKTFGDAVSKAEAMAAVKDGGGTWVDPPAVGEAKSAA